MTKRERPAVIGLALLWCLSSLPALAGSLADRLFADHRVALEVGVENFRWQEFDDADVRLLTEQGPRFVLGAVLHNLARRDNGLVYAARLSGVRGDIDYDGQDSNGSFVSSTTGYRGWQAELSGGYRDATRFDAGAVDLFAGVGVADWERDIEDSVNAIGQPVAGFVEDYAVSYGLLGLGLAHGYGRATAYLRLGFKRPFATDEEVVINGQTVNLSPGERWSGFVSYRIAFGDGARGPGSGSHVLFYYDSLRFAKSSASTVGNLAVWQPKSDLDRFGVVLGYSY